MNKDPFIPGISELAYYDPLDRAEAKASALRAAVKSTNPSRARKTDPKA